VTSLTVLFGILGKKATTVTLFTIAVFAVAFGLLLDAVYGFFSIPPQAVIGKAGELIPLWAQWGGAIVLLILSLRPLIGGLTHGIRRMSRLWGRYLADNKETIPEAQKTGVGSAPT
jgi:hypothetical protein